MRRRDFLVAAAAALPVRAAGPGFHMVDVTAAAALHFEHNSGAFGAKYLPETLGPGCAFLDYDGDGWLDILLVNGMDWPGHTRRRSTLQLYRNNRNGTFTDVTQQAGLAVEMYGMGVAVGDYNNDGFPDLLVTAVGQNRLFQNNGKGRFVDVTEKAGLGGRRAFSTSALWFDFDRDGHLDLFVCNYVKWTPEHDVFCSVDGKRKSYCTPEAYGGATCWLFRNRGDGTFEDVTARSGIFDTSSKSLGVAMLDYDRDGWPDLVVANDTQPNKLYRNRRNGTFEEAAVHAGIAFSEDGKARAGMGIDTGDFDRSGTQSIAITNFDGEMIALYKPGAGGVYRDVAPVTGIGAASRNSLGFGCLFFDADLDGNLDLFAANGHIDETARNIRGLTGYAQAPQLFVNGGRGQFHDVARQVGEGFAAPKVARGAAFGDFDNDGDVDLLVTTNHGPAYLYRNDVTNGNRSVRVRLRGTKSNRDGIGAMVRLTTPDGTQSRMVKSGSSYLSQSELTQTFGIGRRDRADRLVIEWPSGRVDEHGPLNFGAYVCEEGSKPSQERLLR
ncbi:MAG TPA: CRTAC1 family protein [Candidatus Sulfopaludibacter sp.]|nr:CRTAC1 family protein [Candidatus Sulfopaludibacter sp.]